MPPVHPIALRTVRSAPRARLALLVASLAAISSMGAQERPPARGDVEQRIGMLPREVALDASTVWNTATTRRVRGDFLLLPGDTVRGDIAVLAGRVQIAGVVTGRLLAINGSVSLAESGRVGGALTVIGGGFLASERPAVGGELRVWASRLRYRESGDSLEVVAIESERLMPFARLHHDEQLGPQSEIYLESSHTYNRVEGLPLAMGPRFQNRSGEARISAEALGIFRTGDRLRWERANLGHRAVLEMQQGKTSAVIVGGTLFDVVDAVESWQLTPTEVGLASFLFTRDYRDYWQRHGSKGYVALVARPGTELRAEYGAERWSSRASRGVWSLVNRVGGWRVNPQMDEGVLHIATVTGRIDSRNDPDMPRSGWLALATVERASGTLDHIAPTTPGIRTQRAGAVSYSSALLDLRRFNRLAPGAQLNLRVVVAGWLGGDPLPLQRRVSVSGIDALPGFDFRRMVGPSDVGTCATGADVDFGRLGRPAQCERVALMQAEWRGDFRVRLFGDADWLGDRRFTTSHRSADGSWVVFANSGRGWLVHGSDEVLQYGPRQLPPFNGWRTDIGGGVDFGDFGVYVAQAVSQGGLQPNVYLRLGHRF